LYNPEYSLKVGMRFKFMAIGVVCSSAAATVGLVWQPSRPLPSKSTEAFQ